MIIRKEYSANGTKFFTEKNSPQQIGFMQHEKGHRVAAHVHNIIQREISVTQETLIIRKGKIRLDLYTQDKKYIESAIAGEGDIIFLISGGHGLYCLEDVEIIEIKQGPYLGIDDKVRFEGISDSEASVNE